MTKAHSEADDNGGRCEMCNRDDGGRQSTMPVFLGGGLGQGTMWQCARCVQAIKDGKKMEIKFDHDYGVKK